MTTENKKISVKELQTFIDAVEFAADTENWIPSARQWKRIRQMIDNLEIPNDRPVIQQARSQPQAEPSWTSRDPTVPVVMAPSGMPTTAFRAPQPPTSLPQSFASPKTPDIDTSTGEYNSTFA